MPTPYHLLVRDDPHHRGWQLVVSGVMALGGALVVLVAASALTPDLTARPGVMPPVDRLVDLAVALLAAALCGALLLGGLALTGSPGRHLVWSVEGRIRWAWWGRCCLISFGTVLMVLSLSPAVPGSGVGMTLSVPTLTAWYGFVLSLALVPLQATAVELAFRGYLPQLLALVVPVSWIGIVASALFVTAGHARGPWGLVEIGVLAVTAGILTQRTGGLEAAVALHVAFTTSLLLLEAGGAVPTSAASAEGRPATAATTLFTALVVLALVEWQVRSTGLATRREDHGSRRPWNPAEPGERGGGHPTLPG
ncbi:lysostaphin resistance A-like protein [Aeromicrobium alkaliterrae]|uniref:CPBP family intramembrane glutamic endopeptidase n=1 Tax=Aeromicrobium alkaliterrae TaxID=302168 RepID=UPI0031D3F692